MNYKVLLIAVGCLLLAALLGGPPARAQEAAPSEYQVEAAFLYNFAKFVEWPAPAFAADDTPIAIGVLGQDSFGFADDLERTIKNKTANGRVLKVVRSQSPADLKLCHIVFICPAEKKRLGEILAAFKGTSVLTAGRVEHFIESGGMINFFLEQNKVHFEINDAAAKAAGLRISSKLLSLARKPEGNP